jgi:hypothetical protein
MTWSVDEILIDASMPRLNSEDSARLYLLTCFELLHPKSRPLNKQRAITSALPAVASTVLP